ncbi:hypothetical protein JRO89_XSUnG0248700 [Xanthoceras sorbifolium]|uniref:Uncharacterized protein n=1 Tax=Xanthoceras sorbifolium TaxID=99658 RepID=A0ABQ8GZ18_9ROSI|nr:hypothetical protein JRO89_XSUnG0248700 [Xanthoceras sorbifolium]
MIMGTCKIWEMGSYVSLHFSFSISKLATLHRTANSLFSKSSSIFQHHLRLHRCCYTDRVLYASASIDASHATQLRSTDLVALEYADLNLPCKVSGELGHVRIRQHVNPLSSSNIVPVQVPDWNEVYKDPTLPLMVDIGCGNSLLYVCVGVYQF